MLKPSKNPYGFQNLLAYKKAEELQKECRELTRRFPKTKTLIDLADQMDRSARSGKQNIVEGWRRNTTKEYFDFLGFSIGAVAELEEDCGDIWKGRYPELEEIRGVMGEKGRMGLKGGMGEKGLKGERGNPSNPNQANSSNQPNPINPTNPINSLDQPNPINPTNPINSLNQPNPINPNSPINSLDQPNPINPNSPTNSLDQPSPINPINPFNPLNSPFDIEKLKFYPLDPGLPPIVQLKLRCKELNYLLHKLQTSLETKMQNEKTLPASVIARGQLQKMEQDNDEMGEFLQKNGFRRLENGQIVSENN